MWFLPRSTAHEGTPPATAMPTPFNFPCGKNFHHEQYQQNKELRDKCAPPAFEEYWWSSVGYYSPALCPQGYTGGCFRWHEDQGPPVKATETALQCVPQGYVCVTDDISNAFSYSATAPMIQVRWAETDLPDFATHPLYPGVNPTDSNLQGEGLAPTATANGLAARQASSGMIPGQSDDVTTEVYGDITITVPVDEPTGTGDDDGPNFPTFTPPGGSSSGPSLSTGAKAGIGVGVSLVVLIGAGIGAFFFWKWKRKQRNAAMAQGQQAGGVPPPLQPWVAQPQMTTQGFKHELPSTVSPTVVSSELAAPSAAVNRSDNATPQAELSPSNYRGSPGWPVELNSQQQPYQQYTELSGAPAVPRSPAEMESSQQPPAGSNSVQYPSPIYSTPSTGQQPVASPVASPPASTPPAGAVQTQVGGSEPAAHELIQQHAQLEERRQRLLELERIDREQAALQERIKANQGGS